MAVTQSTLRLIRFGAAADAVTGTYFIQKIVWFPTTAGHSLVIQNTNSEVIAAVNANVNEAGGSTVLSFEEYPLPAVGIKISAMTSGNVDIYTI